jgi:hypothetical protein
MSLARLLAAGKSVVGIRDGDTRYRMNEKRLLPRFGAKKNPFLGEMKGSAEMGRQIEAEPKVEPERKVELVRKTEPMQRREKRQAQACPSGAAEDARASKSLTPASKRDFPAWLGSVKEGLSRLVMWPGKRRSSPFERKAFLSYLKLDTVKVVRNDLSGAPDDLFGRRALSGRFESESLDDGVFRRAGAAGACESAPQPEAGALRPRRFFGLWPRGARGTAQAEAGATKT